MTRWLDKRSLRRSQRSHWNLYTIRGAPASSPATRAISCRVVCHPVSRSQGRASESYTLVSLSRTAFRPDDVQEFFPDKTAKLVKFPTTSDAAGRAGAFCTSKSFSKNSIRSPSYTRSLTYLHIIIVHFSCQHARTVHYYIVFIEHGRVRHVPRRVPTPITNE